MKRIIISALIIIIIVIFFSTLAYAALNEMTLQDAIKSFLRYDFERVKEIPDGEKAVMIDETISKSDGFMTFEPVNVSGGWLFDLAGGGKLEVGTGILKFDEGALSERYIDIKGENGELRLLMNSCSAGSEYNKTQFWSAKQQEGTSIVKGSTGEVKNVVLFEMSNGSYCLYGYIDSDSTDFWSLELPESGYYFSGALKANDQGHKSGNTAVSPEDTVNASDVDNLLAEIMSSPLLSSSTGDYIKAHQKEYDFIVAMGENALPHLIKIMNDGDRGLRGNIAMLLIEDIEMNLKDLREISPAEEKLIKEARTSIDN